MGFFIYFLSFIAAFFVIGGLLSYFVPKRIFLITDLRVYIQKRIMIKMATTYIKKNPVDADGKRIIAPDVLTMDMLAPELASWRCGDVFFTETVNFYAARFTPGKWKHAAVYIGTYAQAAEVLGEDSDIFQQIKPLYASQTDILIFDSARDGVSIRRFDLLSELNIISQLRSICLFRPTYDNEHITAFLRAGFAHLGKKYDYDIMLHDHKNIYCAQLLYLCLKGIGIEVKGYIKIARRKVITPSYIADYLFSTQIGKTNFRFADYISAENYAIKHYGEKDLIFYNEEQ